MVPQLPPCDIERTHAAALCTATYGYVGGPDLLTKIITIMATPNLQELHALRDQEKVVKVRIDLVKADALAEAKAYLSRQGRISGEFSIPDVGTFCVDHEDIYNLTDGQRYKQSEAVRWRRLRKQWQDAKNVVSGLSMQMKTELELFIANHPSIAPDDTKETIKVIK